MQKRSPSLSLSSYGADWSANRRIAIVASVVAVLLAVATVVAWLSGGNNGQQAPDTAAPVPAPSTSSSEAAPKPAAGSGSVPHPPRIAEPVAYAKAAAQILWSYDTRTTSRDHQLAGMRAWMTSEAKYADWASVVGQVPDPVLWSRMADQDQHATGTALEGHYPGAFKHALAEDPSAITKAYIYVVTVNGKQQIAWKKGGAGAEERAVTLAVQCRPSHDCSLAAIAPSVTQ
ncbi:hypothetical protein [Streptomyces nymphaeiformis]|uniref:Uncharacterized protein n=1 Tax=Streptomyces nymphaeiformis TaxID=2663842 RepID=A0A7W7XDL3_9ACTN|nr:hypothetical protein [Streptomyces nymphaeiformis]MBB4984182.1 hypothetical protein [Streptomyces nymphaeiformis]